MNPVTFNEPFISLFGKHNLNVPLFDYRKDRLDKEFVPDDAIDSQSAKWKLPFDAFRVALAVDGEKYRAVILQTKSPNGEWVVFVTFDIGVDALFCCDLWLSKQHNEELRVRQQVTLIGADGSKKTLEEGGELENLLLVLSAHVVFSIGKDFTNPHCYICKRTPRLPKGHSIAWQKAREHYVFIHKSHTANSKVAGKQLITDGPLIDRMAHSRRAHDRMLRSARFRHKQGQRIRVKSAWCGPKEWTDRSGQIYKLVEPQAA